MQGGSVMRLSLALALALLACGDKSDSDLYEPVFAPRPASTTNPTPTSETAGAGPTPPEPQSQPAPTCAPGQRRCADRFAQQTCYDAGAGVAQWGPPVTCQQGQWCESDGCEPLPVDCYPQDQVACGADGVLLRCMKHPSGGLVWQPQADCPAQGMPYCYSGACRNECGGSSPIPPLQKPGLNTAMACGSWVCTEQGMTVATNVLCLPTGHPCQSDSECTSLHCSLDSANQKRCAP